MSETATPKADAAAKRGAGQIFVDLGPVIIFMLTYNFARGRVPEGEEIYLATTVFLVATAVALAYAWFKQKRLPPMLIVTGVIVGVFGGLTLALRDPVFIKMKPTIVNLLYAGLILGGLAVKQNVWKMLFQSAFPALPEKVWTKFALRWGLFFIFLAGLNEFIWRTQSEAFWANFKVFGVMPLTFLFMLANMPLLMKHMPKDEEAS
ncbi:MAG: septation protein A [Alphaproteobacteria bacterium]|nr:septation protein A [Alphaproteobacteria bacterium]